MRGRGREQIVGAYSGRVWRGGWDARIGGLLLVLASGERGVWHTEYVRTGVCHGRMRDLSRFSR